MIISNIFKFYNNQCPDYFNELFYPVGANSVMMRSSNKKLPFQKTKLGIQSLSYVRPSIWNNFPDNLKSGNIVSSFKHNIKKYFLKNKVMLK